MTLKDIGEFGFIQKIASGCVVRPQHVLRAIGDDSAAFRTEPGYVMLVTTDMLIEGVHFIRESLSGFDLGYKAMAVNLSDIAAMGGIAREAFVSIAIPKDCGLDYLEDFYNGMKSLASRFDVNILGGDTTSSQRDLAINITVIGIAPEHQILYRNTAQIGDRIYCTGYLGDSRAGLEFILHHITPESAEERALIQAHISPEPHLRQGRFLAEFGGVHAAIDVSDGLSSDIAHIAQESHVGVKLHSEKIPISESLRHFCKKFGFDPVEYALSGGEDYVLICTVAPERAERLEQEYLKTFHQPLYRIGEITDSKTLEIIAPDGRIMPLISGGWDHFKSAIQPR
jgi:thiamine-monophosphate kinase